MRIRERGDFVMVKKELEVCCYVSGVEVGVRQEDLE